MANIHNSDLFKELRDGGKLQQLNDVMPSQLADKVVPVMEVNPKFFRRVNIIRTQSTAITGTNAIYTTPSGSQDFYIIGAQLSAQSDATADNTLISISTTVEGVSAVILRLAKLTTTAHTDDIAITFPNPIKIDRNTAINLVNTFTVGNSRSSGTIYGYLVDNPNA